MILGIGIDIVEIKRIAAMRQRYGRRFERKLFTPREIAYCRRRKKADQHFAVRFAAKEAAMKALGTGITSQVGFLSIEVVNDSAGKPELRLTKGAAARAKKLGMAQAHLSVSHGDDWAVAMVAIEGRTARCKRGNRC